MLSEYDKKLLSEIIKSFSFTHLSKKSFSDGLLSSGRLKHFFRDTVYRRFQCRSFGSRPMFAAADNLPVNKIAFETEGFLHGQECEAENIGFGRENLF